MKAYRVTFDMPEGFCVGFKPAPYGNVPFELDEYEVVSDDAGAAKGTPDESVHIINEYPPEIVISQFDFLADGTPSEPDTYVWRSEEEFHRFIDEMQLPYESEED